MLRAGRVASSRCMIVGIMARRENMASTRPTCDREDEQQHRNRKQNGFHRLCSWEIGLGTQSSRRLESAILVPGYSSNIINDLEFAGTKKPQILARERKVDAAAALNPAGSVRTEDH